MLWLNPEKQILLAVLTLQLKVELGKLAEFNKTAWMVLDPAVADTSIMYLPALVMENFLDSPWVPIFVEKTIGLPFTVLPWYI